MTNANRRHFLQAAGSGAVAISLPQHRANASINEQLSVAVIGPGGMGSSHLNELLRRDDVRVTYVCDVDRNRLDKAAQTVTKAGHPAARAVTDLRRVLDDKSVDAVFIATPDHWHGPASILALDAEKHVYVEKPCCHNIREGRLMSDAVARSGKFLQVGTQSRSTPFVQEAMQRVLEGEIGDILVAKAWNSQRRGNIGKSAPATPPEYLNYDLWVGPAPIVPYRSNMLPSSWRWFRNFGCGDIGNDGVHDIDVALWGLGVTTHPSTATCIGGKYFFDDDQEFPDTQYAVFEYDQKTTSGQGRKQLIFEQRIWTPYVQEGYENGAAFYGTEGVLIIGHTVGWRLYGPRNKLISEKTGRASVTAHQTNFFDCIRGTTTKTSASINEGHRAATIVHLANIAARERQVLQFDSESHTITNHDQSTSLTGRTYRPEGHWAIPNDVT